MKKKIKLSLFLALLTLTVLGQEINQTDAQGRKQGAWKKYYPSNDGLFYEGQFKDDVAIGTFKHYYENGDLKSITVYGGIRVQSEVYYNGGQIMAKGIFIDQKKDSTWLYYDKAGWLSLKEDYKSGLKSGSSISYYPDGSIAVDQIYSNDLESGPFIMYYGNGNKELEGVYMSGNFNGPFTNYYDSGKKMQSGDYNNGKRDGMWLFFNPNGMLKTVIHYKNGVVIKEEYKNGEFTEYYDSGMTKSVYHYKKGLKEGSFIEYYDTGEKILVLREKESSYEPDDYKEVIQGQVIKRQGAYKNDVLIGEELQFDESGKLTKKETH